MRVLVTGAYGLIGSACMARLHADGHDLVAAGRAIADARRRFPYAQWIEADFMRLRDAQAWQPLLGGIDAVVNCVGVLQDGAGDDVQRIQFDGTVALFDGCARARRQARDPHFGGRRAGGRAVRVFAHQGRCRSASQDARARLGDLAARAAARARRLWRQRDAARHRRLSGMHSAGSAPTRASR